MNLFVALVGALGVEPRTYRVKAGCSEPVELHPLGLSCFALLSFHDVLLKMNGPACKIRTCGLRVRSAVLFQLS